MNYSTPPPQKTWYSQVSESSSPNDTYYGTPSIAKDSDGNFWASHDVFGPASTYDTSRIYKSEDNCESWSFVKDITGMFWPTIFELSGSLYIFGVDHLFGHLSVYGSADGFNTLTGINPLGTHPTGYHKSSTPFIEKDGYLIFSVENNSGGNGGWPTYFQAGICWCATSGILDPDSWGILPSFSGYSQSWNHFNWDYGGWLEGNVLDTEDGVKLMMRHNNAYESQAALISVNWDGNNPINTTLTFNQSTDFIDLYGGSVKFDILWDEQSQLWFTVSNHRDNFYTPDPNANRDQLWLISSTDLINWKRNRKILGRQFEVSAGGGSPRVGWQYCSLLVEGNDLLIVSRTAWGGAPNYHDSNRMTFHKVENFRNYF